MLLRSDPLHDIDRLAQQVFGSRFRPAGMAMDAYRDGDQFVVHFDLPGVEPDAIDLTVEKGVLTVTAERQWELTETQKVIASERSQGHFSRQLFLGESLDAERCEASYRNGVLTVRIPVAEHAKPRKVEIATGQHKAEAIEANAG